MHGQLFFRKRDRLMASDWIGGHPYEGMKGFSVALSYERQAKRGLRSMGS